MKFYTTQLLFISLLFFQQLTQADQTQKYQSLSTQEKESACLTVKQKVITSKSVACVTSMAQENETFALRQNSSIPVNDTSSDSIELLLVERHRPKKNHQILNNSRTADVYTYNYQTDTLNYSVVNLGTEQILQSNQSQNVQLPLTENEIFRSRAIANEDPILFGFLEEEYLKITGQPLQSLNQLVVKAFIFLAKSMPGVVNINSKTCGLHRCARLVMHTTNRIALETSPIINLSTQMVSQYRTDNQ